MRLPKISTRQRIVAAALALLVFGFSTAIRARQRVFAGQADRGSLASQSYSVSGSPAPIRYLTGNTAEQNLAPAAPSLVSAGGVIGSHPSPASTRSGLSLILVGLSLVGGAVFMRRITPGQLSSFRTAVAPSPAVNFIPEKSSVGAAK
jgi:hypothetical protein